MPPIRPPSWRRSKAREASVGLEVLEDAMRFADGSGLRYWDAELLRLKGKLMARLSSDGRHEEEEGCDQEALAVARRQQARSLELRAATSLARLWRDEARRLLSSVYGWFTERRNAGSSVIANSRQLVQQRLGLFQIRRVEPRRVSRRLLESAH